MMQDQNEQLTALFSAYRNASPDPEPDAAFTPALWARIDARRREGNRLAILARRMVALAGALSLATVLLVFTPLYHQVNPSAETTYLEALADDHQASIEVDAEESR